MDNIIMAVYPVESEAYQAFSELKRNLANDQYLISQAVLIKKEGKEITTCESLDTGVESADDTWRGSLVGACIGVLAGPVGMLLGMSLGGLTGATVDAGDVALNASLLENIAARLTNPSVAILALVQEEKAGAADAPFAKFHATVQRYDAAAVEAEIEAAEEAQRAMAEQARSALRAEKSEERKKRVEEIREKIRQDFDGLKKKLNPKDS